MTIDHFEKGMYAIGFVNATILVTVVATRRLRADAEMLYAMYAYQTILRSFFPSTYFNQFVLRASWASSILLARTCAAIGETAFVCQIAIFLVRNRNASTEIALAMLVFCIAAQVVATTATVLKRARLFVWEGALWLAIFVLIFHVEVCNKNRSTSACVAFLMAYMAGCYVPNCIADAEREEKEDAKSILSRPTSLRDALYTAAVRVVVTRNFDDWKGEAAWQIPYFVIGPFVSAMLILVD